MNTRYEPGVKFIHIRNMDDRGIIQAKGGATVAYRKLDENRLLYAVAFCHEMDSYDKTVGRDKSAGRLKSPNHADYWEGDPNDLRGHIETELFSIQHAVA